MTTLQVNGSAAAATTLAAAGKMFNATGGTSGNTSTKVGSGTLFKQIFAKGTSTSQTGVASIPAPTDSNFNGWMWDVTTLEGQNILAGTWTPTFHLLASTGTTVTPTVQWYKRSSGGVYTSIGSVAGSSIALTTSSQALTFTPPSLSSMAFATGDKLVMWLWVNQTAGGATNSTISVVEATSGSSAGVTSEAQAATPGYLPSKVTDSTGVRTSVRTQAIPFANVIENDTFVRADQSGWGTASNGQSWTQQQSDGTVSIASNEGKVTGGSAINTSMTLGSTTASDISLVARFNTSSVVNDTVGLDFRFTDTSNYYRVVWNSNILYFQKFVSGVKTTITSTSFTATSSDFFWIRLQMIGSHLQARAWLSTGVEGSTWLIDTTDTALTAAGKVGFDIFANSTDIVKVDSFQATIQMSAYPVPLRIPVRTQVTKSLGLRIVTSTSTLVTKVASLRTNVRTLVTKTISALRTPVRTQVTKTISGVRTPVRTTGTKSLALRILSRTQKVASSTIRILARTQRTVSTGIRAVVKGMTKVANLRVPVRSLRSLSTSLRTRVRSQVSDSTVLRILARTAHSLSSPLRILVQSLKTKTTPLRIRVRTQQSVLVSLLAVVASRVTRSSPIRIVARGITRVATLRTKVRSQHSMTTAIRTIVSTGVNLVTKSAVLRTLARTLKSVSTNLRVKVRSQVSKYSIIRTVVRSLQSLSTQLLIRVHSTRTQSVQLRAVIRGITRLSVLRTYISTRVSAVAVLRVFLVNLSTRVCTLRTPVKSAQTQGACIRVIVLIPPNAVVFVRSGDAQGRVRSGDASAQVRSGDASAMVRSGDALVQVRSGDAAVKVKD